MSATTRVRSAIQFADAAKDLGWSVSRKKVDPDQRLVVACRGAETFVFQWTHDNETDKDSFNEGAYSVAGKTEPWSNVAKALRLMANEPDNIEVRGERVIRLPFDPFTVDDKTLLDALAGKTLTWVNPNGVKDNGEESAVVPARGKQTKIEYRYGQLLEERTITFAAVDSGFRSVRLNTIVEVS